MSNTIKTTLDILVKARELISDPAGWTQHRYWRGGDGKPVDVDDPSKICSRCAVGSLAEAEKLLGLGRSYQYALASLSFTISSRSVTRFNDHHTHEEVLKLFDETIARLNAKEQARAA